MHCSVEVEPVLSVVPLPQLAHDEPSRKKPTLQTQACSAEVEPVFVESTEFAGQLAQDEPAR